jgi:drug/metabolite transporter (DMT)-like permease
MRRYQFDNVKNYNYNQNILIMNKGYLFIVFAVFLWAISSGILVKLATIPPLPFFTIGAFFGGLFILVMLCITKNLRSLLSYTKQQYLLVGTVGLALGISNALFYVALKGGLIANAVLSHSVYPILIVLFFGRMFLREKLNKKILLLVLLSFFGLFILTIPSFRTSFDNALIFGALSALFVAFSCTIEKKLAGTTNNPLVPVFYKNLIPVIIFLPFSLPTISHGISLQNWMITAVWGILVLGVSFVFYFKSLQLIPVSHASIIAYGEPVGAIILAFLFFKQPINAYIFFGSILILLSGIILIKTDEKTKEIT